MTSIGDTPTTSEEPVRSGRRAVRGRRLDATTFRLLLAVAVLSAVAVVVLATRLHLVDGVGGSVRATVVEAFGAPGLIAAPAPIAATVVVISLCAVARRRNSRDARTAATVVASAVLAAVVLATATTHIGIAGLPTAPYCSAWPDHALGERHGWNALHDALGVNVRQGGPGAGAAQRRTRYRRCVARVPATTVGSSNRIGPLVNDPK